MSEVAALRGTNGLRFASTFSGCGGSCLGFEMAGWEPVYALEFVEAARETYRANHHGVFVDERDIREVTAADIMKRTGIGVGELDVFEGSPPCKSFTTAGLRTKQWGKVSGYSEDKQQVSDDLFFEWARILRELQPRAFVAENVPGLLIGSARGYYNLITKELQACGYRIGVATIDAQWCGVPQIRRRIIFVGFRNDLGITPEFPAPLDYNYSIRDAIADLVDGTIIAAVNVDRRRRDADNKIVFLYESPDLPSRTIIATVNNNPDLSNAAFHDRGLLVAPPGCTEDFSVRREWLRGIGEAAEKMAGKVMFSSKTSSSPVQPRHITIPEAKRLCSFPDDFDLRGTYLQQWERLGRAVPPLMMRAVAAKVAEQLLAVR